MQKKHLIILSTVAALVFAAFSQTNAVESKSAVEAEKTVAWYVANIKEAKAQNKECHGKPDIQASPNCANALQALKISFAVNN